MSGRSVNTETAGAWRSAVLLHGVAILPRLRSLPGKELLALMQQADTHLDAVPVWETGSRRFSMPLWDEYGMTGAQLTALLVFGLWVYIGESEHAAGGLMSDWSAVIKSALVLAPKEQVEAVKA